MTATTPNGISVVQPAVDSTPTVFVHGQELATGTEVSIRGKRGRFRYLRATTTSEGQLVLDFIGGTLGRETWHSFYPDRITRVHRAISMPRFNKRGTRIQ